jgi:hypothetical protein
MRRSPDTIKNDVRGARLARQTRLEAGTAAIGAVADRHTAMNGHSAVTALAAVNGILAGYVSGLRAHLLLPGILRSKNTERGVEFHGQAFENNYPWPDVPEPDRRNPRFYRMGKKYEYATSAEACQRQGRQARDGDDAIEWFGLAMYWVVLSRVARPVDAEDRFIAALDAKGTRQMNSVAWH